MLKTIKFDFVSGQLDVQLHLNERDTTTAVPITFPVNITGTVY
jgi:hypothetical protein